MPVLADQQPKHTASGVEADRVHEGIVHHPKLAVTVRALHVVVWECTALTAHEHGTHISTMEWQALGWRS